LNSGLSLLPQPRETAMLLRLLLAALAGAAVGWNRHRAGKPAGMGTHALVALGAALFVSVPSLSGSSYVDAVSRAVQGVATGVGFLGAGEIFRDRGPRGSVIQGLTSAAALWVTAALGLLITTVSLATAAIATALVLAILLLAPLLEGRFPAKAR